MDVVSTESGGGAKMDWGALLDAAAILVREISLFAAAGFLVLGAGDVAIDLIWIGLRIRQMCGGGHPAATDLIPADADVGHLAIFIPAWHEAEVIGAMLRNALARWGAGDYLIYVGCYSNDPATIAAAGAVADPRIRLVVGTAPGPTTKADNLNRMWRAMREDEARDGRLRQAIVLHDAEDVVHSAELKLFASLIGRVDLIQLPVLPLIDASRPWISGHYADEFAESHGKELVVRQALGAAVPLAGVGCAISREAMQLLADRQGEPFDADSLTEDYEIGLKLHAAGCRAAFVRLPASPGGAAIASRGYFPSHWRDAVHQKSRWMAGIALSGWDRLGWTGGAAERWMRLRDRQAPLAALLLCAAYVALLTAAPVAATSALSGHPVQLLTPTLAALSSLAMLMLVWRLVMRCAFVTLSYGWREGLRAAPRIITSNAIAIIAAREAIGRYREARRTGLTSWGKTAHVFPEHIPAE
jgi:bacteriophage N4 adsorption protein B